jgi:hypothetical protein
VAHGEGVWDGVEVLRAWLAVLERISRLGFWEREANVRRDWMVAHCLQILDSARRRLLAIVAAIVGAVGVAINGSESGGVLGFGFTKFEVLRSLLTSSHATSDRVHIWPTSIIRH